MGLCRKTICLLVVFTLSGACFAQAGPDLTTPVLKNPIDTMPGTVPVSSYQNSLVRSPNPVDNTGNLIVTGNIGGGKHFRGTVPYNAISDFGGRLGSGTLDDFMRRSTISTDYYSGGLTPYYSYSGTVTRFQPGTNMVITSPSSRIRTDAYQQVDGGLFTLRREGMQQIQTSNLSPTGKLIFLPIGEELLYPDLSEQQQQQAEEQSQLQRRNYQVEMEDFNRRVEELRKEAEELEKQLGADKLPFRKDLQKNLTEKSEDQRSQSEKPKESEEKIDIYDRMIKEYQENKKVYDQMFPEEAENPDKSGQQDTSLPKVEPGDRKLEYKQAPRVAVADKTRKDAEEEELSDIEIEARARVAIEDYKSFASKSNDEFNKYMRSAEENMKSGKFYKAADDYSLASIYNPSDPLAYAGKSHALFAAGEYLSSALNLNRAIEIFGGYAEVKVDVVAMIGDKDTVEKRLADIDTWYEVTSSPELKFLQAYIYLQIDRLDKATDAIEDAYYEMSDIPAVGILKQAIENKTKK
ncbi:MAG: hypothetical protein JW804_04100 [Sedimentisphaerales bacterium]|nr:hypothetical protein [Sedimentisphaerales bacterium]